AGRPPAGPGGGARLPARLSLDRLPGGPPRPPGRPARLRPPAFADPARAIGSRRPNPTLAIAHALPVLWLRRYPGEGLQARRGRDLDPPPPAVLALRRPLHDLRAGAA